MSGLCISVSSLEQTDRHTHIITPWAPVGAKIIAPSWENKEIAHHPPFVTDEGLLLCLWRRVSVSPLVPAPLATHWPGYHRLLHDFTRSSSVHISTTNKPLDKITRSSPFITQSVTIKPVITIRNKLFLVNKSFKNNDIKCFAFEAAHKKGKGWCIYLMYCKTLFLRYFFQAKNLFFSIYLNVFDSVICF